MTTQSKITQATMMLLQAFADEVAKHKLSTKMTPDQIMAFFDFSNISPVESKRTTPEKTGELWEGELGDLPKGISEKRSRELLAIAEAGVPDGMKIHTKKKELFKPNKQHAQFYTKGPFSGPKEDEEIIDWLVELAGDVGPPPEPEVVAQLPAKWANDKKKAINLLVLVTNNKKKAAEKGEEYKPISWDTSRGHPQGEDDFLYDDEFDICGPKKTKAEFLNLVAWYKEHPGVVEEAAAKASPKPKEKAKGKKATKAKESKKDDESDKDESEASEPEQKVSKKKAPAKNVAKAPQKKLAEPIESEDETKDDDKESDETKDDKERDETKDDDKETDTKDKESDDETIENDEDDESSCDENEDSKMFVLEYDQAKLDKFKAKLQKLVESGSEKYLNCKTGFEVGRNEKSENKFIWNDEHKVAMPKDLEEVADDFVKMLTM